MLKYEILSAGTIEVDLGNGYKVMTIGGYNKPTEGNSTVYNIKMLLGSNEFDTYKNCKVTSLGGNLYNRYNEEIWIQPTKRLQCNLCKNCSWTNCWENPSHPENIQKTTTK